MYEELKAALIPASERIALIKEALHLAQKIQLAAIFIIIFGFVFFLYLNIT